MASPLHRPRPQTCLDPAARACFPHLRSDRSSCLARSLCYETSRSASFAKRQKLQNPLVSHQNMLFFKPARMPMLGKTRTAAKRAPDGTPGVAPRTRCLRAVASPGRTCRACAPTGAPPVPACPAVERPQACAQLLRGECCRQPRGRRVCAPAPISCPHTVCERAWGTPATRVSMGRTRFSARAAAGRCRCLRGAARLDRWRTAART